MKDKEKFIVTCNCGCGNSYIFRSNFDLIWIEGLISLFYSKQEKTFYKFKDKIKYIHKINKNKPIYLNEICLSEEDLKEFLENFKHIVETLPNEETEYVLESKNEKFKTKLHLSCSKLMFSNESLIFTLGLKSNLSIFDIIFNKEFRQYDTTITKNEAIIFIKKAEKFINKMLKEKKKLKEMS